MADAQSTTTAAEQSGAPEVPQAELHLQLAKEEINHARALMMDKENERAAYMLLRARADADLSLAEATAENVRVAARKAQGDIAELRKSIQPGQEVTP